jgi:hypothetical protein
MLLVVDISNRPSAIIHILQSKIENHMSTIPQRIDLKENSGNAVRYRVAACRKRLREVRTTYRTHLILDAACTEIETTVKRMPDVGAEAALLQLALDHFAEETESGPEAGIT